jgi:uncharacterized protein (TIGR03382 family)
MSKSVLLALTLPLGMLAGCTSNGPDYLEFKYPIMTLGQASMEFGSAEWGGSVERTILLGNEGGMTMGVGAVYIGERGPDDLGEDSPYTVAYDIEGIECAGEVDDVEADTDAEASAKGVDLDTGGPVDTDIEEPDEEVLEGALFLLEPGCQIPLTVTYTPTAQGDAYDALIVESVGTVLTEAEEDEGQYLPDFTEDKVHTRQVVYLHGESEFQQGALVVRPRSYDFGFVHPDAADEESPARIQIANVGDGDVTVLGISDSCDPAIFDVVPTFGADLVLEGGDTTLVEVSFTPADTDAEFCALTVYTNDPANPEVSVTIRGNSGDDPQNVPPTVFVRSPENGYRYSTIRPLTLELNIFDENQPATSLVCKVKSLLTEASVANCAASDDSGHVFVEIPADDLEPGVDTLTITVTDGSDTSAYASVSVVINSDYPADDDDGDGYGVASEPADCDDANILSYPAAAEVFDGEDNDCDGDIDEGTEGADDDADGFSEADGDCNDYTDEVFPLAPEQGDGMDNDCDGIVDEGTDLSDDDGDGYAEVNGDCEDDNVAINPTAVEVCDGDDNDCDGLYDSADGCASTDSVPVIVGNTIRMEQSACHELEVITMDVTVFDADQDTITFDWSLDEGSGGTIDNRYAQVVNYTAPEIAGDKAGSGKKFNIYAVIFDEDANQDWAFGKISVWDENTEIYDPFTKAIINTSGGCSSTGGGPTGALMLAGAALALAFRRRE